MAGLIERIRRVLAPPEEAPVDPQELLSFYSSSDELVQRHFNAVLLDDLKNLAGVEGSAGEEWAW
ncbi:MAG TPA: hypothetical protein VLA34_08540 [Candidatus Krumholzibacterium sp.]|nr:hypothetical protein [Candidatus Krumholzibacterium sp.]